MRSPRFRVRMLLILVLLAGVASGTFALSMRSAEYGRRAARAELYESRYGEIAKLERFSGGCSG